MATDRTIHYQVVSAQLGSTQATDAEGCADDLDCRTIRILKTGTENAATNVAETIGGTVFRAAKVKAVKLLTGTNVAGDNTDYLVITVSKRTGATKTTIATCNTHLGAQGDITQFVPESFSLVAAAQNLAVNDVITYEITKAASGKQLAALSEIAVDIQEV
jgi:hypothetical protein